VGWGSVRQAGFVQNMPEKIASNSLTLYLLQ